MTLPPFVYVKAFWEFLGFAVSGVLGILYVFGVVPLTWVVAPAAITSAALAVLQFFDIEPQLRARAALMAKKQGKKSK